MKVTKLFFVLAVLLLALFITGCGSQSTPVAKPTATEYAYPPPMNDPDEVAASLTVVPEVETVAPTDEAPDPEPTEVVAAEPEVDNCIECHTDQQSLIDTSDPVAEIESENEGEG